MENTTTKIEILLDVSVVAAAFGISKLTLRRLWKSGQFVPPLRIGRRSLRWRLSDIQNWIQTKSKEIENGNCNAIKMRNVGDLRGQFAETQ
jgi:predicted DNA-binding transcriptional regulator AlpA